MRIIVIALCILVLATVMIPCVPIEPIAILPPTTVTPHHPRPPIPGVFIARVTTHHLPRAALPA